MSTPPCSPDVPLQSFDPPFEPQISHPVLTSPSLPLVPGPLLDITDSYFLTHDACCPPFCFQEH